MAESDDWVSIVAVLAADEVDLVAAALWDAGIAGIEERDLADGRVELVIGCRAGVADACTVLLGEAIVDVAPVSADAGLDGWREHAQAWRAGSCFVIVPPWIDDPDWIGDGDVRVSIDPGHAFGSGSHETTRLCIAALERTIGVASSVADIGCGSGVLAIIAAGLGARSVVAVDIDPAAVAATADNVTRNGADGIVSVREGSAAAVGPGHDVVVANIAAPVLIADAAAIAAACAPHGVLLLSGMLSEQVGSVIAAYVPLGWSPATIELGEDWAVVELRDPAHAHDHHHH